MHQCRTEAGTPLANAVMIMQTPFWSYRPCLRHFWNWRFLRLSCPMSVPCWRLRFLKQSAAQEGIVGVSAVRCLEWGLGRPGRRAAK